METNDKKTVNYIITGGHLKDQLPYSLFKLLDWSVGKAVCIIHDTERNYILINECKRSLQERLIGKFGGEELRGLPSWGCEDTEANIYDVIKEVTEWVNE